MRQQEREDEQDYAWYYRDKSQNEGPRLLWCATWPEGLRAEQQRVNFIARLYFTAPDRAAALREFRRWACIRMEDIPYVALVQLPAADVPTCPHPRSDCSGLALSDGEYRFSRK